MNNIFISILLVFGALFILIASIGLLRFKDFYSRMHAATKATSFGILLLLIGVILHFGSWNITVKSFLIILFIYTTAPLAAHSIAKSFKNKIEKE
jgi:multicomponent Na+:H+ antiporter subunit G